MIEDDYQKRKQMRREAYQAYCVGFKKRRCSACNGSGYYDHNGSPKCGACNGTGRERYRPMVTEASRSAADGGKEEG